jgi:hypothetical protein
MMKFFHFATPGMTGQKGWPLRFCAAALLCSLAVLCGCASPGSPMPPSLHLPRPVSDLQAQRVGDSVQLRWTMSGDTTDSIGLTGQKKVTVCRRVGAGVCAQVQSFPEMPKAKVAIEDVLPPAVVKDSPALLTYEVQVLSDVGRSAGASNPAYAASGAAPSPVNRLRADVTERGVMLRWEPSAGADTEILLRRERVKNATPTAPVTKKSAGNPMAPKSEPDVQLLRVHADAGGTLDASAVFGEQYAYTVERVKRQTLAGQSVEIRSEPDTAVDVNVRDVFPPQMPQGLEAADPMRAAADGTFAVDLSWEANTEPDLAGYYVYRYVTTDKTGPVRMNAAPLAAPAFHDAGLQGRLGYAYSVSAVDKSGNESKKCGVVVVSVPQ